MKAYLLISGTIFAFLGTTHLVILARHWPLSVAGAEFVIENAALSALGLGLALWAFRLARGRTAGAG